MGRKGNQPPVGLDGLEAYRCKGEERGENEEWIERVLQERKKRCRAKEKRIREEGGEETGKTEGEEERKRETNDGAKETRVERW